MKTRLLLVGWIALSGLTYVAPAHGQCLEMFFRSVAVDTKRNNCWPEPFLCPDRAAVRSPFVLMVHNGWRRQNLLSEHHFQEGNAELNESGRLKIRWIVEEAPRQHKVIYVRRTDASELTAARMNAVQELAARLAPEGEVPPVLETTVSAAGWPAERVDVIDRKFRSSMPDPKLPGGDGGEGLSN